MARQKPGQGRVSGEDGNEHEIAEGSGADAPAAAPAPAGGDAQPSNTASHSYMDTCRVKVLRIGVDSLYLSYYGEIAPEVEFDLSGKKQLAQSPDPRHHPLAQWEVQGHIFEVSDRGQAVKGQGGFAYVLEDKAFRIAISSSRSRALPFAYVKISSEYLAHAGPEAAVEHLSAIIGTFGKADQYPLVSRVDLYADFQSSMEMEGFPRHAWVGRSGSINTYSVKGEFSGYTIGHGASMSARLYDKSLEIRSSHKAYFLELWQRAGMDPNLPVWRLEFQIDRQVLYQLGVRSFEGFIRELGGIWAYATQTWLRLAVPHAGDSNRARWPTHPLWERLAGIVWGLADVPMTRTFSPERVPSHERLFRLYFSILTSFIGSVRADKKDPRLLGFEEGQAEFLKRALAFNSFRCMEHLQISFADYVAQEIAIKAKRYNTLVNIPRETKDGESTNELDRYASDYYRATRGE